MRNSAIRIPHSAFPNPAVTVIVPTLNRAWSLRDTLECLARQVYPADRLEVIVVDNSSTDDTEQVVRDAQERSLFPMLYFRKDDRGPAASRNFGLARASGEVIGFTDSDCQMGPHWVRKAVAHMADHAGLVCGPIRPVVNPSRVPGFFHHQIEDLPQESALYPTANIFYRREAIQRAGGFDESFGTYPWGVPVGGEDTDLAWRVKRLGYGSVFAEDAPVYHAASNVSILAWLMDPVRAQVLPCLVARYPELRRAHLWRGYLISRQNGAFYLALMGAALAKATRTPLALALAFPWLWALHSGVSRDWWPPARWWRIPVKYGLWAARFGVLAGVLAASSLRHRSLVL